MRTVIFVTLAAAAFASAKDREWQTGKVVEAYAAKQTYATEANTTAQTTGTVSPDYGAGSTVSASTSAQARIQYVHVKTNDVIIVGPAYIYNVEDAATSGGPPGIAIGRAVANRHHGCRFVVGEDIRYAQEKDKLYVVDADGKQCKVSILRQQKRE